MMERVTGFFNTRERQVEQPGRSLSQELLRGIDRENAWEGYNKLVKVEFAEKERYKKT